jgi:hypothetical protein
MTAPQWAAILDSVLRAALLAFVLFLGCSGPKPEQAKTSRTASQPDPNAAYQGGPYGGPYQWVQKITLS